MEKIKVDKEGFLYLHCKACASEFKTSFQLVEELSEPWTVGTKCTLCGADVVYGITEKMLDKEVT